MKKFKEISIIVCSSTIILASCAVPKPVLRVVPTEKQTTWEQGKEFVSYQKNSFVVHCAYHGIDASYLIFDIEVINGSQENYLVSPENFLMYTDSGSWNPITNQYAYKSEPIRAADPELQLLKLEMRESVTEAQLKNQQTAAVITAVATLPILIATATADTKDSKPRVVTRTDIATTTTVGVLNGIEISQAESINSMSSIGQKQNIWTQYALRKTTLSPGESVRGLIYFAKPDQETTRDIKIDVPILNDDKISFGYRIVLYYPNINQANY